MRSVFIIGPDKKIKLMLTYPMTTGRNFDEILRVLDSMQLTAKHKVATPVNWKQGEDVIIAGSVSDDDAKKLFPNGWKAPKPYLRIVKQPGWNPDGATKRARRRPRASSARSAGALPGTIFGEVPIALGTPFPGGYRAVGAVARHAGGDAAVLRDRRRIAGHSHAGRRARARAHRRAPGHRGRTAQAARDDRSASAGTPRAPTCAVFSPATRSPTSG